MLALVFRGIFLIGILVWYSTSMWKMIDGYFKDQFQRYLEAEYQKNPLMKIDVKKQNANKEGNNIINFIENSSAPDIQRNSSVGKMASNFTVQQSQENLVDKADFLENCVENEEDEETQFVVDYQKRKSELAQDRNVGLHSGTLPRENKVKRPTQDRRRSVVEDDSNSMKRAKRSMEDNEFWEFEDEEDEGNGILINDLHFRSKVDLANLERVSTDEFCPLSIEDEESCGEIIKWP